MSTYKGGLSASGPFTEKAKLMRRPTPDSDVLASSDDDHDHGTLAARAPPTNPFPGGRRPSSGWLQDIQPSRKFSLPSGSLTGSQPTTPSLELPQQSRPSTSSFPWNTNSFTSPSNNRLKEVLPSPTSAVAPGDRALPSPTNFEGDDSIGHLLNQQNSVRKSVRSQSYSVGQQDIENSSLGQFSNRVRPAVRHRPSNPSLLANNTSLTQLREDDFDDVESSNGSDHGVRLPSNYWEREQKQALLKQAAVENARRQRAMSTSSPVSQQRRKASQSLRSMTMADVTDYAVDENEDVDYGNETSRMALSRRFSEQVGTGREYDSEALAEGLRKPQWSTGTNSLLQDNLARRHSFATMHNNHNQPLHLPRLSDTYEEDEETVAAQPLSASPGPPEQFDPAAYFTGYGPASRAINASAISAAHPDPVMPHTNPISAGGANPYAVPAVLGRPSRRLFVVSFKCSRAEIYYLHENTGLEIRPGDLVIVEGDRGADLGQVTNADVSQEDARKFKAEANEEHFRWLVMFSQYSLAGAASENNMLGALARANGFPNMNRAALTGMGPQQETDSKPKMIKRLAQQHEIMGLRDKEGQEAKAKRVGAQKAGEHKLQMEILDAEYQADYHKLTYYYYAEAYVNFNDLVTDLFKQYKVRIWMSAVNPASVVNPAGLMQIPPPSAIGPGAILHSSSSNTSLPVGPGFGASGFRQNEQYGRSGNNGSHNYEEGYYPFANQIPGFPTQQQYGMAPWAQGQHAQDPYGRYGAFPLPGGYTNPSASASPVPYGGGFYPPATFSSSPAFNNASNAPSYRGGYPATSSAPSTSTPHGAGGAGSYGNGFGGTSSAGYDPAYLASVMQSMNINK